MARPKKTVEETIDKKAVSETKRDKTAHEEKLWCVKCQRGIDGLPDKKRYAAGDTCPMCLQKYRFRKNKNDISGKLDTIGNFVEEKKKRDAFKIQERERNQIRGIKDADDLVREAEEKLRRENDDLRAQMKELRELITANKQ